MSLVVFVRGLDGEWAEQPAVRGLGAGSFRAYVDSLLYVTDNLTDGRLPATVLGARGRRAAPELVEAGLWRPVGGGWLVVQWERHAPARAAREKARALDAERQRRRRARGEP